MNKCRDEIIIDNFAGGGNPGVILIFCSITALVSLLFVNQRVAKL
jgi:hypothetical protein